LGEFKRPDGPSKYRDKRTARFADGERVAFEVGQGFRPAFSPVDVRAVGEMAVARELHEVAKERGLGRQKTRRKSGDGRVDTLLAQHATSGSGTTNDTKAAQNLTAQSLQTNSSDMYTKIRVWRTVH